MNKRIMVAYLCVLCVLCGSLQAAKLPAMYGHIAGDVNNDTKITEYVSAHAVVGGVPDACGVKWDAKLDAVPDACNTLWNAKQSALDANSNVIIGDINVVRDITVGGSLRGALWETGLVIKTDSNGFATPYFATADTNTARWTALETALNAAASGDVIRVGIGNYDANSTSGVTFPAGVLVKGWGFGTVIKSPYASIGSTPISTYPPNFLLRNGSIIEDLVLDANLIDGTFQYSVSADDNSIVTLNRVTLKGDTDVFYLKSTNSTYYVKDCNIRSHFDTINTGAFNNTFICDGSKFLADYSATGVASGIQRCVAVSSALDNNKYIFTNCDFNAVGKGGASNQAYVYGNTVDSNTQAEFHRCAFVTSNCGYAFDIANTYTRPTVVLDNCTGSDPNGGVTTLYALPTYKSPQVVKHLEVRDTNNLGSELIVSGSFATETDANWIYGSGWAWTANEANHNSNGLGGLYPAVSMGVKKGNYYLLTYTVTRTSGSVTPSLGGVGLIARGISGTNTYSEKSLAIDVCDVNFVATNTARLRIDNVSVKQIMGSIYVSDYVSADRLFARTSLAIGTTDIIADANTPSGAIAKVWELKDVNGVVIGYIPIYAAKP